MIIEAGAEGDGGEDASVSFAEAAPETRRLRRTLTLDAELFVLLVASSRMPFSSGDNLLAASAASSNSHTGQGGRSCGMKRHWLPVFTMELTPFNCSRNRAAGSGCLPLSKWLLRTVTLSWRLITRSSAY